MKKPSRPALIALLLVPALAVGACSKDTASYPSLGIRPTESIGFGEPAGKPVVVQPDPTLDTDIAAFRTQLDRIRTGFAKDAASTQAAARAARGGAVGSEPWLTAQTALAGLDDWRAQTSLLVTDIERRATDRAATLAPAYPALDAVRDAAQAEAEKQGTTITQIQASLPAA